LAARPSNGSGGDTLPGPAICTGIRKYLRGLLARSRCGRPMTTSASSALPRTERQAETEPGRARYYRRRRVRCLGVPGAGRARRSRGAQVVGTSARPATCSRGVRSGHLRANLACPASRAASSCAPAARGEDRVEWPSLPNGVERCWHSRDAPSSPECRALTLDIHHMHD
jgi:hypothetical protein